ncbi:hypothetical protein N0V82_005993 [Gnomoniopsis sp. IMI 355080]|nr:hypothetical protein N0V82_005993 [Gnomoniopsis sp. IMI 355080]
MSSSIENVAIVGGGLAGVMMALALHKLSVPCVIYEARATHSASKTSSGALMLSPNSLRILDYFGLFAAVREKSYAFEWVYYKNSAEETIDRYPLGGETTYGYNALRIYRQELLDILYDACFQQKIPVNFNKKFTKVIKETQSEVILQFADNTTEMASLVIGADGIHSRLRNYVCPGVEKKFMGMAALTWETPTKQLRIPQDKDYKFPVSILSSKGVFVMAPQRFDGSAMLSGTQFRIPEQNREQFEQLISDKAGLIQVITQDMDGWPDIVRSNLEAINADTMNLWMFYSIPPLPRWASEAHSRVVILGDAAHAIPPTTGNGASQAFEDAFSLALLLSEIREHKDLNWEESLAWWQKYRQGRVDKLLELTRQLNNKRLPLEKQALLEKGEVWVDESAEKPDQMAWLYVPTIEEDIRDWVNENIGKTA